MSSNKYKRYVINLFKNIFKTFLNVYYFSGRVACGHTTAHFKYVEDQRKKLSGCVICAWLKKNKKTKRAMALRIFFLFEETLVF